MVFEKVATVTYNQFPFISKSMHQKALIFGMKKQLNSKNMLTKFQKKTQFVVWEKMVK
jgi:hypothetical protein